MATPFSSADLRGLGASERGESLLSVMIAMAFFLWVLDVSLSGNSLTYIQSTYLAGENQTDAMMSADLALIANTVSTAGGLQSFLRTLCDVPSNYNPTIVQDLTNATTFEAVFGITMQQTVGGSTDPTNNYTVTYTVQPMKLTMAGSLTATPIVVGSDTLSSVIYILIQVDIAGTMGGKNTPYFHRHRENMLSLAPAPETGREFAFR